MMLESEAPLYALPEVATPLYEGQLSTGPRLDLEVGGDKNGA